MTNRTSMSKILIVVLAFIVAFLIIEFALRIMDYHPRFMEMNMFVEEENELLPYKLKPNYTGYQIGKEVAIDSEGNRVIKPSPNKPSGEFINADSKTILILGDSVVFGFGLQDDKTIASQFQTLINQADSNYVVKNIAAPGYTSWNEYEALNQYLVNHEVDIVVLFYVFNDITLDNHALITMKRDQEMKYSSVKKALYKNIYLLSLIKDMGASLDSNSNTGNKSNAQEPIVDQLYRTYLNQEALDYSIEAISKIKSLCEQNNIELIVAIPRFHMWYYNYPEFSKDFETEILSKLNNIGVSAFVAKSHIDNLSIEEINVFRNDYHPSPLAVKYLVSDIYNQIENKEQ